MSDDHGVPDYKLAQFDYDTPITEWPDDEVTELLNLLADSELEIADALATFGAQSTDA